MAGGKGLSKWIRGEYGTGKTFAARFLCAQARQRRFATSEVQISINDTPLHHLETVYRRLIERLETAADGPNAFQAIVEGWLYQVGDEVMRLRGIGEDDPAFRGGDRAAAGRQAGRPFSAQPGLSLRSCVPTTGPPMRVTLPPPRGSWPGWRGSRTPTAQCSGRGRERGGWMVRRRSPFSQACCSCCASPATTGWSWSWTRSRRSSA